MPTTSVKRPLPVPNSGKKDGGLRSFLRCCWWSHLGYCRDKLTPSYGRKIVDAYIIDNTTWCAASAAAGVGEAGGWAAIGCRYRHRKPAAESKHSMGIMPRRRKTLFHLAAVQNHIK